MQEVATGRGGDRTFHVGERGAVGAEGCGGGAQGYLGGSAVQLTEGLHVLERV